MQLFIVIYYCFKIEINIVHHIEQTNSNSVCKNQVVKLHSGSLSYCLLVLFADLFIVKKDRQLRSPRLAGIFNSVLQSGTYQCKCLRLMNDNLL